MNRVIPCMNTANGQVTLVLGGWNFNQSLVDTITLLLSLPDITDDCERELKYDMDSIEFVENGLLNENALGEAHAKDRFTLVAPKRIAKAIAKDWVKNNYINYNYAVAGTTLLLTTILHEAMHCHTHRAFVPNREAGETWYTVGLKEEEFVYQLSTAMFLEFVKTYGISLKTISFMWALVTEELSDTREGRKIIEAQCNWLTDSIVSTTENGMQIITIREDMRQQYRPTTVWPPVKKDVPTALIEMFQHTAPASTIPEVPRPQAAPVAPLNTPAPPVVVVPSPVPPPPVAVTTSVPAVPKAAVPPPPVTASVPVPTPPSDVPAPPELNIPHPVSGWVDEEAELIAIARGQEYKPSTSQAIPAAKVAEAIYDSPVYSGKSYPTVGDQTTEDILQQIGEKITRHIFKHCGWSPKDCVDGFKEAEGVYKDLDFNDIPGADKLIKRYTTLDEYGRHTKVMYSGTVRGLILSPSGLPVYQITFDTGKQTMTRKYKPQGVNSIKSGTNQLTKNALLARGGTRLLWVLDEDITDYSVNSVRASGKPATKFIGKYEELNFVKIAKRR